VVTVAAGQSIRDEKVWGGKGACGRGSVQGCKVTLLVHYLFDQPLL